MWPAARSKNGFLLRQEFGGDLVEEGALIRRHRRGGGSQHPHGFRPHRGDGIAQQRSGEGQAFSRGQLFHQGDRFPPDQRVGIVEAGVGGLNLFRVSG